MDQGKMWWQKLERNEFRPNDDSDMQVARFKASKGALAVGASFAVVVAGMVGFLVAGPNPEAPKPSAYEGLEHQPSVEATIAQCGGLFTYDPPREQYGNIPDSFFVSRDGKMMSRMVPRQPMVVPAYGYFMHREEEPTIAGFVTDENKDAVPDREEVFDYLWHGGKIVWYDKNRASSADIEAVKVFVEKANGVAAIPWTDDRALPAQRGLAFSSWQVTQSCAEWDEEVFGEFVAFAEEQPTANKDGAVPDAILRGDGELHMIDPEF